MSSSTPAQFCNLSEAVYTQDYKEFLPSGLLPAWSRAPLGEIEEFHGRRRDVPHAEGLSKANRPPARRPAASSSSSSSADAAGSVTLPRSDRRVPTPKAPGRSGFRSKKPNGLSVNRS